MEFELMGFVGTGRAQLSITEPEFDRIVLAKTRLLDALRIEEKFGMLIENYREFEESLLDRTLHHMLFQDTDYSVLVSEIYLVTRRLQNLLSTARLYVDQVTHDLSEMYGAISAQRTEFERWTNVEYDARFGYRVMEALRNFMQHQSLPSSSISINSRRRELPAGAFGVHTADPSLDVVGIRTAGGFKPAVLAELEARGSEAPLKPLVRDYIEGVANVHHQLRQVIEVDVTGWESAMTDAIHRLASHASAEVRHVNAISRDGTRLVARHDLFDGPVERRRWLGRRNSKARHVASQIASSEAG